jgi:glycosyltransferase involved in cell wall biosynthesis
MIPAGGERVLILAVGMGTGGAESLIRAALGPLRREGFEVALWALKDVPVPAGGEERSGPSAGATEEARTVSWARLAGELRAARFDLIHSHLFWANLAARTAGRLSGVPAIVNSHHGIDAWPTASHRWLERRTIRFADRVVVCSEAVRSYARDRLHLPEARLVAIPNGIASERFRHPEAREKARRALGLQPGDLAVGSVGRLDEPVKGYSVLLSAFRIVAAERPRTVCLVAGGGAAEAALRAAADAAGLSARLRFLGERQDIPEFLQALDLYVQPSRLEGFGLAALEAMAAGLPVVASRTGGLPEVIEDKVTGDLVAPGDPGALAAAVLALLADPARRASYGAQGARRAAERFPLQKMVHAWADLYRAVLRERGRQAA